ncbi:MAG: permease [Desulfobulbaceae bacterium]|nr:permease [Desulfobulbaceae bacterium]
MSLQKEWKPALWILAGFLACFFLPVGMARFDNAVLEAFHLVKWYAREHVLLCLIPAFFIAGAISVFISRGAVMKYLGPGAGKIAAYTVASASGTILAVCSCTVLPLFAGIYRMGAGLGPASAFLYSGPAINVLAIILTGRILGTEMGIARAIGAILFSVIIGLLMEFIFRNEIKEKSAVEMVMPTEEGERSTWQNISYFAALVGILVFANWGKPAESQGVWAAIYGAKWFVTSTFGLILAAQLVFWFKVDWWKMVAIALPTAILAVLYPNQPLFAFSAGVVGLSIVTATANDQTTRWFDSSWGFAKQIIPLLFFGVLIAGALLGRVGHEGLMPSQWVAQAVGGNSPMANFLASFVGVFMYFATLTEVPILQGLIGNGMGKGPALALLLAGPALSLPNMLVIRSVLGTKKTLTFVALVVVMSTMSGMIFGHFFG